jgi:hypothetical protein
MIVLGFVLVWLAWLRTGKMHAGKRQTRGRARCRQEAGKRQARGRQEAGKRQARGRQEAGKRQANNALHVVACLRASPSRSRSILGKGGRLRGIWFGELVRSVIIHFRNS